MNQKREAVRIRYPFNSWSKFLQHQAGQGNEIALAILRSKKEKSFPERPIVTSPSRTPASVAQNTLASVTKMRELFRAEGIKTEPQYTIDTKGTVLFRLPNSGTIRDTGAEAHFTANNEQTKRIASKLAQARWGQSVSTDGNVLKNALYLPQQRQQEQNLSNAFSFSPPRHTAV